MREPFDVSNTPRGFTARRGCGIRTAMTAAERWICQVCWKSNSPLDRACWKCKAPRDLEKAEIEETRKAIAARALQPEVVPDLVVALPVVIFRSYAKAWMRGGMGMVAVPILMGLAGVVDVGQLLVTGGLAVGLIGFGIAAGEVVDGMREREVWAFVVGLILSIVGAIGSVVAFQAFAPDLISAGTVRLGSLVVFGGAGAAALAGLVLLYTRRDRTGS